MKVNDFLAGIAIAVFAVLMFFYAQTFPTLPGQNIGPKVFPQLIAIGFMVCAALLIFRSVKNPARGPWLSLPTWLGKNRATSGVLLIPWVLIFYVLVSERLGFLITAVLMLLALFYIFEVKLKFALPVALLGALGVHTLFYQFLKVPLPWGVLTAVAW
jgi:putative tricarboxylic transport membrane protein